VKLARCPDVTRRSSEQRIVEDMNTTTPTIDITVPETLADIHDFYVVQVNNLVAEDREWMIPSLTAEYDRIVEHAERVARAA
jgi:hypothetical protein